LRRGWRPTITIIPAGLRKEMRCETIEPRRDVGGGGAL
jgi:hypothetical protein